jgi:hypothetical protein
MTQLPENKRIERKLHRLEKLVREQSSVISCITSLMEILMANQQDALGTVAELRQAIVDDQASDQAVVDRLDAALAEAAVNADTQPLIDAIKEAQSQIVPATSTH